MNALMEYLGAGALVRVEAEHMCMNAVVSQTGTATVTARGLLATDKKT